MVKISEIQNDFKVVNTMNLLMNIRRIVYKETEKESADSFFDEFDNKVLNQLKIMCYKIFQDNKKRYLELTKMIDDTLSANQKLPEDSIMLRKLSADALKSLTFNLEGIKSVTGTDSTAKVAVKFGSPDHNRHSRRTNGSSSRAALENVLRLNFHDGKYNTFDSLRRSGHQPMITSKKTNDSLKVKTQRPNRNNLMAKNLKTLNLRKNKSAKNNRTGSNLPGKLRIEGNSGSKKNRAQSPALRNLLKRSHISNDSNLNNHSFSNSKTGVNFRNKRAMSGTSPDGGSFILGTLARNHQSANKDQKIPNGGGSFIGATGRAGPLRISSASTNMLRMIPSLKNVKVGKQKTSAFNNGAANQNLGSGRQRHSGVNENNFGSVRVTETSKADDHSKTWVLMTSEKEIRKTANPRIQPTEPLLLNKTDQLGVNISKESVRSTKAIRKPLPIAVPAENRVTSTRNIPNLGKTGEFPAIKKLESFEITGAGENPELRMVSITDCDSPERNSLQSNILDFDSPKVKKLKFLNYLRKIY